MLQSTTQWTSIPTTLVTLLPTLLSSPAVVPVKNLLFILFLYRHAIFFWRQLRAYGIVGLLRIWAKGIIKNGIYLARTMIPGANAAVEKQISKTIESIQANMAPTIPGEKKYITLPEQGLSRKFVRNELNRYQSLGHVDWKGGKVSGAIYHGGEELNGLITEAYGMFSISNPLHPEVFPGVRKMESEIVSMGLNLFHAPVGAAGSVTSGGTESILMAIKAYRDMAREKRGITEPEMVVPKTAHAAFDKGASYFGVRLIHVPFDENTGCVDMNRGLTLKIVGSAPGFPHGVIDDLPALSALAKKHRVGFHVDCCLGGFLVPFMDKAGFPLPHPCDFRLEGATSISVDTHKYGFAPKGSSLIMYRSKEIRNYQYFTATDWPGGVYASPSMAGSRPGALLAGCWAAMLRLGVDGYTQSTQEIVGAARKIRQGISQIKHLRIIGDPLLSVVAFDAILPIKTYAVADLISRKGWHLNVLQFPPAIHMACTLLTVPVVDDLLRDISEAVDILIKDPKAGNGELSAIYGTAASVPDRSIITEVSRGFLDGLTKI